jgi:hypothetical protein
MKTNNSEQLDLYVSIGDNGFFMKSNEKDIEYINLLKSRYRSFLDRMGVEKEDIGEFVGMGTVEFTVSE